MNLMTWQQSLNKKTALITGASSGIGEACAQLLAAHNVNLILTARREERLLALQKNLLDQYPISCEIHINDVAKPETWGDFTQLLQNAPIDILINNAGLALGTDKMQHGKTAEWDQMLDTNVKGLLHITRHVLPNMIARNTGHIVNLGSIAGHGVYTGAAVYCASKHAVDAISKALRFDVLGTPIRVTEISPGMVETEFSVVRFRGQTDTAETVYNDVTPLVAMDIAQIILYTLLAPSHVNISEVIVCPTDQAGIGGVSIHRHT